jgi:2-polyprenyl-3-methyl-5-hydroxy-6-metoxy-1,4-benzoquinol methylase
MGNEDYILKGSRAEVWHRVIGELGDEYRQALLNPIVVSVLNEVASQKVQGPQTILAAALASLPMASSSTEEIWRDSLQNWHADTENLKDTFPHISSARFLDLGCGNGYLGNWLGRCGVSCLGIEPSAELISFANAQKLSTDVQFENSTIQAFCTDEDDCCGAKPDLISVLAVFDQCCDPSSVLRQFSKFLRDRKWADIPILVATLDPDFFLPGLPTASHTMERLSAYGIEEDMSLRDPALWEEMFSQNGFFVLEQRPVHIGSLPENLASHALEHHAIIHCDAILRVPPRQGPFYLWLLSRRPGDLHDSGDSARTGDCLDSDSQIRKYYTGDDIELIGNIGTYTQKIISGSVEYYSESTNVKMPFSEGDIYGQMELSGNYYASRLMGSLKATADTVVESISNSDLKKKFGISLATGDKMLVSMVHHLDSVRYDRFISPRSSKLQTVNATSGKKVEIRYSKIKNVSATVLKYCSDYLKLSHKTTLYKSRYLIELDEKSYISEIFGATGARKFKDYFEEFTYFVNSNTFDCFTPHSIYALDKANEPDRVECDIIGVSRDSIKVKMPDHLGCLVAVYLLYQYGLRYDEIQDDTPFYQLPLFISSFLKNYADGQFFEKGKSKEFSDYHSEKSQIDWICDFLDDESGFTLTAEEKKDLRRKTISFLNKMRESFSFKPKLKQLADNGLSKYIVLRDVGVALSLIIDESSVSRLNLEKPSMKNFYMNPTSRSRIFSYFQEVIGHLGICSGFIKSPWSSSGLL